MHTLPEWVRHSTQSPSTSAAQLHHPKHQLTSMEVLFLPFSAFSTLSLLCLSTLAMLTLAQGAESERALTSVSDTSGAREVRGTRGAVLICLLTCSMLPTLNTVEAGMHLGREGSAHLTVKEHIGYSATNKHSPLHRTRTYMNIAEYTA